MFKVGDIVRFKDDEHEYARRHDMPLEWTVVEVRDAFDGQMALHPARETGPRQTTPFSYRHTVSSFLHSTHTG